MKIFDAFFVQKGLVYRIILLVTTKLTKKLSSTKKYIMYLTDLVLKFN